MSHPHYKFEVINQTQMHNFPKSKPKCTIIPSKTRHGMYGCMTWYACMHVHKSSPCSEPQNWGVVAWRMAKWWWSLIDIKTGDINLESSSSTYLSLYLYMEREWSATIEVSNALLGQKYLWDIYAISCPLMLALYSQPLMRVSRVQRRAAAARWCLGLDQPRVGKLWVALLKRKSSQEYFFLVLFFSFFFSISKLYLIIKCCYA